MSIIYGRPLFIGNASPKVPEIFGTGEDGDLYIAAGETVTLPVPVPHQSVVEKNYKSITIEAGGTLTTADYNAGLVLRCQGDCTISGTVDQSGKAPKTNPGSTYQYPPELICGDGGAGGTNTDFSAAVAGGQGMPARAYGGGYGGGGAGGWGYIASSGRLPGKGGDATGITVDTPDSQMFIGGASVSGDSGGNPGTNGGGGGGCGVYDDYPIASGAGGTGPGTDGGNSRGTGTHISGAGGGAGNVGGGVVLLYSGGVLSISGSILCNGLNGGAPGNSGYRGASSGGGGGGGSIYIIHNGTQTVTGSLNVNGGTGGNSGGIGTTTIKQYTETA